MFGGQKNSRTKCPEFLEEFCYSVGIFKMLFIVSHSGSKQPKRDPKKVVSGSGFGLILSVEANKNLIRLRINFARPNFVMRILQSLIISDEILT